MKKPLKVCGCGTSYSKLPETAKLFKDENPDFCGYWFNCACRSTLFVPETDVKAPHPSLWKLALSALVLVFASGCATGFYYPTKTCYVPNEPKASRAQMEQEFSECSKTTLNKEQHSACMFQRGYNIETCYQHNNKPVSGAEVVKTGNGPVLGRAANELSLKDLE